MVLGEGVVQQKDFRCEGCTFPVCERPSCKKQHSENGECERLKRVAVNSFDGLGLV